MDLDIKRCAGLKETNITECPTILEYTEKTETMVNNEHKSKYEKILRSEKQKDKEIKKDCRFSTMQGEIRNSIEMVKAKMKQGKDVPLVQAELLSRAYEERGTDPQVTLDTTDQRRIPLDQVVSSLTNQSGPKDLFKIAMPSKTGTVNHELTEITTTSSGAMEMALDKKTIELIDNSTKENPNLFVALKKSLSGHYVMKFNKDPCVSSESQKMSVKRTDSGKMILEVHKNLISTIQPDIFNSKGVKEITENMSSLPIGLTTKAHQYTKQQSHAADKEQNSTNSGLSIKKNEIKGDFGILRYSSKESEKQEDKKDSTGSVLHKPQDDLEFISTIAEAEDFEMIRRSLDKLSKQATEQVETPKDHSDVCENNNIKSSDIINDIKKLSNIGEKMHKMLLNNNTALDLTVLDETGVEIDLKANLTTTHSGHIAVNMKEIANSDQIAEQLKEKPVLLENKNCKYLLNVNPEREMTNATLRKTSSGEIYAVLTDSVLNQSENEVSTSKPNEILHKIRVKGLKHIHPDSTCLIRTTISGNYEFILDKDFGKQYEQKVNNSIGDDNESCVNLSKTESGCYLIDFEDNVDNSSDTNINALLVKSHSGNIKLIVKSSTFENIETEITTGNSCNVFGELFKTAPQSSRELHREHLAKSKFLESKSCSDSHVYGKVRIHHQKSSLIDPPAILKKTISGQYTVVLNKDSKLSFINNLKNYISKSGRNLIPIKRSNGGDIIICLNQDHECKGQYGSLKITPSGNIYVFVEENVLQEIERNAVEETAQMTMSEISSSSVHMIGTLVNPRNKAVTTTCNSKRDCAGCDKSKCVCSDLVSEMNKWGYSLPEEKARASGITWYQVVKSTDYGYRANNTCHITDSSKSSETESDKFSHSDIEPTKVGILRCTHPTSGKHQFNNEQCYYVIDTDRVAPKQKHVDSSNDLIQIVGPCFHGNWKEAEINKNDFGKHTVRDAKTNRKSDLSNLDYLESLPPQLPSFLRG